MATSSILPFATGNGASVVSDTAWAASGVIAQGFQNGVADPTLVNKALRQGTSVASGFGLFTAAYSGQDFADSLTSQAMSDNFRIALAAALDGARMGVDTSATANTITFPLTPTPAVLTGNKVIWIKPANNVTGATTVQVLGANFSALPLKRGDGNDPQSGDLIAGRWYATTCDGTQFKLLGITRSEINALIAAAGGGGANARLNTLVVFTTPGTTTWTCPPGVTLVRIRVYGGGGGGVGNTGSAGGGGGYAEGWFTVVPGTVYTLVIGAGGAGVASTSSAAGNGGSSSFGTLGISATGGNAGGAGSASPGVGGTGSGGQFQAQGGAGGDLDGNEVYAPGGTAYAMPSSGGNANAVNPGQGGVATSPGGSPANTGYNGAPGAIFID